MSELRSNEAIEADYAIGPDGDGYDAATERLAHDAGPLLAEVTRLRAKIERVGTIADHWQSVSGRSASEFARGAGQAAEAVSGALAEECPDCASEDRAYRSIVPTPNGGLWGYTERECTNDWHAEPSGTPVSDKPASP